MQEHNQDQSVTLGGRCGVNGELTFFQVKESEPGPVFLLAL